jgi:hypothetical protein
MDFSFKDDKISACRDNACESIDIFEGTFPYVYAAARQSVLVGTNYGDVLLFKDSTWCRMAVDEAGVYRCPKDTVLPAKTQPSNQFYSSLTLQGKTLVGEYPTGLLYEFDGSSLFLADMPQPEHLPRDAESQSIAFYCGDIYVGYWPSGEVLRFDGKKWHEPIRLFSKSFSGTYPHQREAEEAGLPYNFFGRRAQALVPYQDSLYAAASSKSAWYVDTPAEIGEDANEYGVVHRIWKPGCSTTHMR